jgi:hypothetical protein
LLVGVVEEGEAVLEGLGVVQLPTMRVAGELAEGQEGQWLPLLKLLLLFLLDLIL